MVAALFLWRPCACSSLTGAATSLLPFAGHMDLPWNPAVLEQRIARIHRMGQKHPVQSINYVSKGTIEEGMLSVLDKAPAASLLALG